MHGRRRLVGVSLGSLFALSVCGSNAGTEVEGGGGGGRYAFASCGVRREFREQNAQITARHRTEGGWSVTADVRAHRRELTAYADGSAPDPGDPAVGTIDDTVFASVRAGYHGEWAGIEAGPTVIADGDEVVPADDPPGFPGATAFGRGAGLGVIPSAEAWVGKPETVYVWTEVLSEIDSVRPLLPIGAGLGRDGFVRARVGVSLQGVTGEVRVPLGGRDAPVCAGVKLLVSESDSYWVGGTLTYRFGERERGP